ncbi:MAG TPA: amidohydrolase family protein [Bryobacteraceae bacterium]|jgi:cytosine/adenosine deaminase-related metal-dependent hydrolase
MMNESRRRFLAAAIAAPPALSFAQSAGREAADAGLAPLNLDPNRRILLKGGTIVSMDPAVGDFAQGDILIQGKKIVAVGVNVKASGGARVIDASNTIVIPGFVDCHRHSWEGVLRRIIPNGDIAKYMETTHQGFAPFYRPRDMYVGNLITALGCIDAGITCIIDNSHNSRSAAHSDAAVQALFDSGIRAVHASGAPQSGTWDRQWPQDLERLQRRFFTSDDQLVTLRMFSGLDRENYAVARKLNLRITTEFQGAPAAATLEQFWNEKRLGADVTYNHCGGLTDLAWQRIRDSGGTVDVCPRSDPQYALGEGVPAFQKALDHDLRPGLSVDNEVSYGTDMFTEMRVAFFIQRAFATNRRVNGDDRAPKLVNVRELLECATVNGAACAGLSAKCGSLTPGKEADLVMIRTDDLNLYPSNNAVGTVVAAADIKNVDTVIVGGVIRKSGGKTIGVNWPKLRQAIDESRAYLFQKAGYKLDIFSA